ncbi:acyl-CoA dehydrogenase family protein [Nakamurella alba]|uniref:acyl-CoA dehydrogenase family protein n=1 Tax=Nakamurella alba TaxID=2665158 RepID=UPI002AC354C2|nr:acyl-CoA dehydrogenase family protein [Nakamurella alba]
MSREIAALRSPRTIYGPEHEQFRAAFRSFLQREALPHRERWLADGIIDRDFWKKAAADGFVAFTAPERFGGLGIDDFRFNAVIDEEVAYLGAATDAFQLTNDIVGPYFWDLASPEQQERWLPGIVDGSTVPAIAMTEPGTGSDLRGIRSTATRTDGGWLVNGSKTFITSGIQADLIIVAAKVVDPEINGIGLFVVDATTPGFRRGRKLDKVGRQAQDTAELFFDDVLVPDADVLGEAGRGLPLLMGNLAQERLAMAVSAIADAEQALQDTLEYVSTRTAFGAPVGTFQANRFSMADMVTEVRIGRVYVDDCIERQSRKALPDAEAAGAKYWATELQWRVLDRCLQLHGGYGYMNEYDIARRWRDARVQRIYGGTSEIMQEIVGRSIGL